MPTPCSDCTQNIGLFKRKQKCDNCHAIFCDKCFGKSSKIVLREAMSCNYCLKCNIFGLSCFRREELLLLSTKDLRYFLCSKNIDTQHCKERYHLVDLIMKFAEQTGQKSMTDIRREEDRRMHVENLRMAAQRREEEETRREEEVIFRATANEGNLPGTPLETPPSNMTNKWKSIEDIASADDIESLSNIELKKILTVNFVDYKGCVEKSELIEKVKRLWNSQNLSQKAKPKEADNDEDDEIYDEDLCKVCMDSKINCVLLDCGHLVTCTKCGRRLAECPICRQLVVRVVHVFKA